MERIRLALFMLFAMIVVIGPTAAHAQWTVFDPSTYGEEVENFGQLYNENQTTLQHLEMAIQQYNLLNSQYQQVANIAKYGMNSRNLWSAMPFQFNSQGRITGWGTTLDAGTYPNAYTAVSQSQYMPASLVNPAWLTQDMLNRWQLRQSSVDLKKNSLQDALAAVGGVRNASLQNDAALTSLIADSRAGDASMQTSTAIAQKTSIATTILAQGQSDANKQLAAMVELEATQIQEEANDRAMELQDESNRAQSWQTGATAGGTGTGNLSGTYSTLRGVAATVSGSN